MERKWLQFITVARINDLFQVVPNVVLYCVSLAHQNPLMSVKSVYITNSFCHGWLQPQHFYAISCKSTNVIQSLILDVQ